MNARSPMVGMLLGALVYAALTLLAGVLPPLLPERDSVFLASVVLTFGVTVTAMILVPRFQILTFPGTTMPFVIAAWWLGTVAGTAVWIGLFVNEYAAIWLPQLYESLALGFLRHDASGDAFGLLGSRYYLNLPLDLLLVAGSGTWYRRRLEKDSIVAANTDAGRVA